MHLTDFLPLLTTGPDHPWGHGGWWWLWGVGFLAFWILLFTVIAVSVWFMARRGALHRATGTAEPSGVDRAKAILAERFARGEISAEEYDDRLTHLS